MLLLHHHAHNVPHSTVPLKESRLNSVVVMKGGVQADSGNHALMMMPCQGFPSFGESWKPCKKKHCRVCIHTRHVTCASKGRYILQTTSIYVHARVSFFATHYSGNGPKVVPSPITTLIATRYGVEGSGSASDANGSCCSLPPGGPCLATTGLSYVVFLAKDARVGS